MCVFFFKIDFFFERGGVVLIKKLSYFMILVGGAVNVEEEVVCVDFEKCWEVSRAVFSGNPYTQ